MEMTCPSNLVDPAKQTHMATIPWIILAVDPMGPMGSNCPEWERWEMKHTWRQAFQIEAQDLLDANAAPMAFSGNCNGEGGIFGSIALIW
jgi:hypothetical protein